MLQELEFQKSRPQVTGDKFASVVSQFVTVASFSFSDVEDSLQEAKELVSAPPTRIYFRGCSTPPRIHTHLPMWKEFPYMADMEGYFCKVSLVFIQ